MIKSDKEVMMLREERAAVQAQQAEMMQQCKKAKLLRMQLQW